MCITITMHYKCLSFLRDDISGSCSMNTVGIDLNSGKASSLDTVYNKIGRKETSKLNAVFHISE